MDSCVDEVLLKFEIPGEFLLTELQNVYFNSTSFDVQIHCKDGQTVGTHSTMLAIVSPYLKEVLAEAWSPYKSISILLPDFSAQDVKNLLQFLYTGEAMLNLTEYETIKEIITEFQIISGEESTITIEEITRDYKIFNEPEVEEAAEKNDILKAIDSIVTIELTGNPEETSTDNLDAEFVHLCTFCGKTLDSENELDKHMKFHRSEEIMEEHQDDKQSDEMVITEVELILDEDSFVKKKSILCEIRPSVEFSSQTKQNNHKTKHSDDRPHKCHLCGKSYPVKATLTAHLRLHADDKPHQCDKCGKAFLIRSLLEQHLRTHTNERPFSCEVCGKAFRNQSNLIGHRKTHNGDRPYCCDVCGKSFNRKNDLDAHVRIHTGDKPFACTICTKSFRFRSALRVHLKGVHKPNQSP